MTIANTSAVWIAPAKTVRLPVFSKKKANVVATVTHTRACCQTRRGCGDWYQAILAVAGGLRLRGLTSGDHFVAVLSNRYETATLYWACQMLGAIFTPFNWRANGD